MDGKKIVTIGLYFEIKDSELYGGMDSVGYASINVECTLENLTNEKLKKYLDSKAEEIAGMCKVPVENVKPISREEYEEKTEE